ncbi:MAG: hypothetical protein IPP15_12020 [Saprospiraceae bacterium]|uniref:Uncharacterized protein n=1 Tax=Candidatus Opimibacter skivensis TaxID=2982028 RepID=A0A9D7XTY2_9BACT|nr:hypothetical protein [Candidatus Opimibacter skivensis]
MKGLRTGLSYHYHNTHLYGKFGELMLKMLINDSFTSYVSNERVKIVNYKALLHWYYLASRKTGMWFHVAAGEWHHAHHVLSPDDQRALSSDRCRKANCMKGLIKLVSKHEGQIELAG